MCLLLKTKNRFFISNSHVSCLELNCILIYHVGAKLAHVLRSCILQCQRNSHSDSNTFFLNEIWFFWFKKTFFYKPAIVAPIAIPATSAGPSPVALRGTASWHRDPVKSAVHWQLIVELLALHVPAFSQELGKHWITEQSRPENETVQLQTDPFWNSQFPFPEHWFGHVSNWHCNPDVEGGQEHVKFVVELQTPGPHVRGQTAGTRAVEQDEPCHPVVQLHTFMMQLPPLAQAGLHTAWEQSVPVQREEQVQVGTVLPKSNTHVPCAAPEQLFGQSNTSQRAPENPVGHGRHVGPVAVFEHVPRKHGRGFEMQVATPPQPGAVGVGVEMSVTDNPVLYDGVPAKCFSKTKHKTSSVPMSDSHGSVDVTMTDENVPFTEIASIIGKAILRPTSGPATINKVPLRVATPFEWTKFFTFVKFRLTVRDDMATLEEEIKEEAGDTTKFVIDVATVSQ
jgi:hypothetical protein